MPGDRVSFRRGEKRGAERLRPLQFAIEPGACRQRRRFRTERRDQPRNRRGPRARDRDERESDGAVAGVRRRGGMRAGAARPERRAPRRSRRMDVRDGEWRRLYTRADLTDPDSIEREVRAQLECCRDLLGRTPTHLDSHQHVHRNEPLRSILRRLAAELAIPLRHFSPAIRHHGGFYGQSATGEPLPDLILAPTLVSWFAQVPEGVTELACHPGYANDLDTMYGAERTTELRTLCAGEVRRALADEEIQLASFADVEAT